MTLHDWAVHHGSDKGKAHQYCDFYEKRIGQPKTILEFGVLRGQSLQMWHSKFPTATVIGLDIVDIVAPAGTFTFKVDCNKSNWITSLNPTFDLILDDAGHFTEDQIAAFELWWPFVAKGGRYVIEDCHTMHYEHYNPNKTDFKAWVNSLGIKHEYYTRVKGDESDSMTLIFYK